MSSLLGHIIYFYDICTMKKQTQLNVYQIVGQNIRQFRKQKKINQLSLASQVNLSRTSLVNIEYGRQQPSLNTLWDIAQSLGVTLHDLVPRTPFKEDNLKGTVKSNINNPKLLEFIQSNHPKLNKP